MLPRLYIGLNKLDSRASRSDHAQNQGSRFDLLLSWPQTTHKTRIITKRSAFVTTSREKTERMSHRLPLAFFGSLGTVTAYRYSRVLQRERELPVHLHRGIIENDTTDTARRCIVVGGGVVGITTAYKLANKGWYVTVVEPRSAAGEECSACAAGGMQRSNVTVDRDTWMAVLKSMLPGTPYQFFHMHWTSTITDPFFLRWLFTFTATSLLPDTHQDKKQGEMLKFTKYAVEQMKEMMLYDKMDTVAGYNARGSVSVSYEASSTSKNSSPSSSKMSYEPSNLLTGEQLLETEPSLRLQKQTPVTAKFEYEAAAASSMRFTKELATRCDKKKNVTILYDTAVKGITVDSSGAKPRISSLKTNHGVLPVEEEDHVVIAAGAWTPRILALMDLYVPVYPLKGYAISISAKQSGLPEQKLPSRIVSDPYLFTSRLGDEIRITSIGEFSGWSTTPTKPVDAEFRREADRRMPQLKHLMDQAVTRCGHRPYVSDGILLLGTVDTHSNLYVSCGPGSNGWKLVVGSAEVMERLVAGQPANQVSQELGFDAGVFSPVGRVLHAPLFAKLCRARWDV